MTIEDNIAQLKDRETALLEVLKFRDNTITILQFRIEELNKHGIRTEVYKND